MKPSYWLRQKRAGVCIEEFLPDPKKQLVRLLQKKKKLDK